MFWDILFNETFNLFKKNCEKLLNKKELKDMIWLWCIQYHFIFYYFLYIAIFHEEETEYFALVLLVKKKKEYFWKICKKKFISLFSFYWSIKHYFMAMTNLQNISEYNIQIIRYLKKKRKQQKILYLFPCFFIKKYISQMVTLCTLSLLNSWGREGKTENKISSYWRWHFVIYQTLSIICP